MLRLWQALSGGASCGEAAEVQEEGSNADDVYDANHDSAVDVVHYVCLSQLMGSLYLTSCAMVNS